MAGQSELTADAPQPALPGRSASRWSKWHLTGLLAIIVGTVIVLWPAAEETPVHRPQQAAQKPHVSRVFPGPADLRVPAVTDAPGRLEARSDSRYSGAGVQRARLQEPSSAVRALSDEELGARLLGKWRTNLYGEQTIHNEEDGAASLHARLDFLSSLIYGNEMQMDLRWSVRNGVLTHVIVSGTPATSVNRLIQDQGDRRSYRILNLTDSELKLQDVDDPSKLRVWTRVASE
jgi:hypothetical protein